MTHEVFYSTPDWLKSEVEAGNAKISIDDSHGEPRPVEPGSPRPQRIDIPHYAQFEISGGSPLEEYLRGVSTLDTQVDGDHYRKLGAYQPWEVLKRWLTPEEFRGYMKGTAIAYLARERDKGADRDVRKATHTLEALIELGALV